MDASEPRVRRRGLFLQTGAGEPEAGDLDSAEGLAVRVRIIRPRKKHLVTAVSVSLKTATRSKLHTLRSASAIGSRPRPRSHR